MSRLTHVLDTELRSDLAALDKATGRVDRALRMRLPRTASTLLRIRRFDLEQYRLWIETTRDSIRHEPCSTSDLARYAARARRWRTDLRLSRTRDGRCPTVLA